MTKDKTELTRDDKLAKLREEFPSKAYGKLPKPYKKDSPKGQCNECGGFHGLPAMHLDYIGHATVTDRLLSVDPEWNWEPCAMGEDGLPKFVRGPNGQALGLWIRLTILGITRLGYGSVEPGAFEAEKQLIGDALRNAAMRFGVALDLWSKAELESAALSGGYGHDTKTGEVVRPVATPKPPTAPAAAPKAATQPKEPPKPPSRPAPSQEPRKEAPQDDGIDPQAVPEQGQDGWVYQGLPISDKIAKGFDSYWGKYPAVKDDSKMKDLVGYTWQQLTEGSPGGKRERALRFVVARARDEWIGQGKMPIEWSMKAAWTLNVMYQRHASDDVAAANGLGRRDEEPMPSGTLFNGESDETPF